MASAPWDFLQKGINECAPVLFRLHFHESTAPLPLSVEHVLNGNAKSAFGVAKQSHNGLMVNTTSVRATGIMVSCSFHLPNTAIAKCKVSPTQTLSLDCKEMSTCTAFHDDPHLYRSEAYCHDHLKKLADSTRCRPQWCPLIMIMLLRQRRPRCYSCEHPYVAHFGELLPCN